MLSRRTLLGAGAGSALLAGCGVVPPFGAGTERLPSPSPTPLPGHEALTALHAALLDADAAALPSEQARLVTWALGVTREQDVQTSMPEPTATASPSVTASVAAPDAALSGLVAALGEAAQAFRAQALDPAIAAPLTWASMAAWAAALVAQLPAPTASPEPARGILRPAEQEPDAALQAVVTAAGQTIYALEVAAGAPGLTAAELAGMRRRITAWLDVRDDVTALARAASASPTPAAPWYDVDRPDDAASARALAARVQATALPILGGAIANGPEDARGRLADALAGAAVDVPAWGGLLERWPGLPVPS